ncbi:unnamed protein product [Linum trigynum]|uniref:Uncharacterized protein n=1 Tax=Linum trigynum TaxID=586398 RepID=A0AAV2GN80_9ROSI
MARSTPSPRLATLLLLAIVLLQTQLTAGDLLSSIFAPIMGNICENVECGRGKCKPLTNSTIPPYECECDAGWKQTRPDAMDNITFLNFLPCIVPNCSMDFSCNKPAEAPVQDKSGKSNTTLLDPCNWADCGGGSCNKTSLFTYSCVCSEGYNNLLNTSLFPCYKECAVGMDCKDLGITVQGPPSPTPVLSQNDGAKNQGSTARRGFLLMVSLVVTTMAQW